VEVALSDIQADAELRRGLAVMARARTYAIGFGAVFLLVAGIVLVLVPDGGTATVLTCSIVAAAYFLCAWRVRRQPGVWAVPWAWMVGLPMGLFCVAVVKFGRLAMLVQGLGEKVVALKGGAAILRERPHLQAAREWRDERPDIPFPEIARRFLTSWNGGRVADLAEFLPERTRERHEEVWVEPLRNLAWLDAMPKLEEPAIRHVSPWEVHADFRMAGRRTALRTHWLHREGAWGNVGRDWPKAVPAHRAPRRAGPDP
jgi:hypothetical protein